MSTKYCSRCGSILEKGAKFCTECGAKTDIPADIDNAAPINSFSPPAAEEISEPIADAVPAAEETVPACESSDAGPSPADTWQKADAFSDAPKSPDVSPTPAYWSSDEKDASEGTWQTNPGGFQQMAGPAPGVSSRKSTVLFLGIITIVFAVIFPLMAYVCGIIGLVMASKAAKAGEDIRNGRLLCIIGLVLAVLSSAVGILVTVFTVLSEMTDVIGTYISY